MTTKTKFTLDSNAITTAFNHLFSYVIEARFKLLNEKGNTVINFPLYIALIIGIFLPFVTLLVLLVTLIMSLKVIIEKTDKSSMLQIKE